MLEDQLKKSRQDVAVLRDLKNRYCQQPEELLTTLRTTSSLPIPRRVRVMRYPEVDLKRWQQKVTRRSNTPYEQNAEYLVSQVHLVQRRTVHNESAPLTPAASESSPLARKRAFPRIRDHFLAFAEGKRTISLPSLSLLSPDALPLQTPVQLHQPKPKAILKSPSSLFASPSEDHIHIPLSPRRSSGLATPISLPSASLSASPLKPSPETAIQAAKPRIRRYAATAPEQTSLTHNVPWSDDEKRKLEYLLTVFPEEDVQARRYAKIAAALGTRTANQVASRYQKLLTKAQRNKREGETSFPSSQTPLSDANVALVAELDVLFASSVDPDIKSTPEYEEYCRLKAQLDAIKANPLNGVIHHGFKCDCCGSDPIIGPRWTCISCPRNEPSIDLCPGCVSRGFETQIHKMTHVMKKIELGGEDEDDVFATEYL
jgi:hypothetical protein